jgi:hypothetical protein
MLKKSKGKRPVYLDSPEIDKLLTITLALAGEVSVLRERLDTMERLLEAKGIISQDAIATYQPDLELTKERETWRSEYLARILGAVTE